MIIFAFVTIRGRFLLSMPDACPRSLMDFVSLQSCTRDGCYSRLFGDCQVPSPRGRRKQKVQTILQYFCGAIHNHVLLQSKGITNASVSLDRCIFQHHRTRTSQMGQAFAGAHDARTTLEQSCVCKRAYVSARTRSTRLLAFGHEGCANRNIGSYVAMAGVGIRATVVARLHML